MMTNEKDNGKVEHIFEEELDRFVRRKETELGLEEKQQWFDPVPRKFLMKDKASTTILFGGLTMAHDYLVEGALQGLGFNVQHLDCPDTDSLRLGKEFGNRGQCNPTYFTVGNLIKHLTYLRDVEGKSKEEIVGRYLFITSGSCGPCRFGTYVTEYRKALRDAGFDGFRVLLFQQQSGLKQATGEESALKLDSSFFLTFLKTVLIGDILNAVGYRIRPYEIEEGATNEALDRCKKYLHEALRERKWLLPVLRRCRKELMAVKVDRTIVKPKVSIIGEFWAMTTEGDGNYQLQKFLEQEGAEVEVQSVTAWILFLIWEGLYDTKRRMDLRKNDGGRHGLEGKHPQKRLALLKTADRVVRVMFQTYAKALGLRDYHLPDMEEIARVAREHYNNHLRGGEGHMEVGKLILNVKKRKVNMTISVKPFGCMPSSGVSDGVQSLITERYPEAIFLPIETTGDGAVNVYSRIQMMLFKAKQAAQKEFDDALAKQHCRAEELQAEGKGYFTDALETGRHVVACTAANMVYGSPTFRRPAVFRRIKANLQNVNSGS
ncbi:Predicted nucleotide-binding protein, sugar kinase/HSP70/actin superfamily [Evansella caseinilytica]|uniref:Predicted nucleotide-binding protein, sugar kinase/HSP70/actin superfamily n=1 Tax=Evansella caseinilytica TaxID=1503961 RepID=A0A1H3US46_9BACI|nr:2-hydroxyglutaryl-CoA dehydratase [Evansella caseinilytica]SDZ64609.1 Predicted nucleotide-binding protein, sugar kinase/HSP70/actin superfamily [Evansella caseinilytica]